MSSAAAHQSMSRRARGAFAAIAPYAVSLAVTVLAIDSLSYFLLPDAIAFKFNDYRMNRSVVGTKAGYKPGYFVAHPQRGHDIAPNVRGSHEIPELIYPIWSNSFGCFDREWEQVPRDYVYFAGDSFTWGYSREEDRFASRFERVTGIPSIKCGVTATSTRHQFDKFKEVFARIGHAPRRVVVSLFSNDFSDDYAYPATTVIDGWLVGTTYLSPGGAIVRPDAEWLRERVAEGLRHPVPRLTCAESLWLRVKCVSATANVLNELRKLFRSGGGQKPAAPPQFDYRGEKIVGVFTLDSGLIDDRRIKYATSSEVVPNREAVRAWKKHAEAHGYQLSFMLIPPPPLFDAQALYVELRAFLDELSIEHLDLTETFAASGVGVQLYWRYDGHFSPIGHRVAAEALVRRWGR
jgi:hypothetical protein